jgi:hypothetical protein
MKIKSILLQLLLALIFAVIFRFIYFFVFDVFSFLGWGVMTIIFSLTLLALILFHWITNIFSPALSVISFVINFLIWVAEQVCFEKYFNQTFLYRDEETKFIFVFLFASFLFSLNKILIDFIFIKLGLKPTKNMMFENLIQKLKKK